MSSAIYLHIGYLVDGMCTIQYYCRHIGPTDIHCKVQYLHHSVEELDQEPLNIFLILFPKCFVLYDLITQFVEHVSNSGRHSMDQIIVEPWRLNAELFFKHQEPFPKQVQKIVIKVEF